MSRFVQIAGFHEEYRQLRNRILETIKTEGESVDFGRLRPVSHMHSHSLHCRWWGRPHLYGPSRVGHRRRAGHLSGSRGGEPTFYCNVLYGGHLYKPSLDLLLAERRAAGTVREQRAGVRGLSIHLPSIRRQRGLHVLGLHYILTTPSAGGCKHAPGNAASGARMCTGLAVREGREGWELS